MKLGRELIARDADGPNHRLGRQRPALEAVDANHGAGSRHVLQLLLQHRRIVRKRLDLIAGQRASKRGPPPIRRGLLGIERHGHVGLDALNRQYGDLPILARSDAHAADHTCVESRESRAHGVETWLQCGEHRHARAVGAHVRYQRGVGLRLGTSDAHDGAHDDRAGLVHHGDAQRPSASDLPEKPHREQRPHRGASSFRGSIRTLTLTLSNVVSSIVVPAIARRSRNGHPMPLTARWSL